MGPNPKYFLSFFFLSLFLKRGEFHPSLYFSFNARFINKETKKRKMKMKGWNAQSTVANKNRVATREKEEKEEDLSRRLVKISNTLSRFLILISFYLILY